MKILQVAAPVPKPATQAAPAKSIHEILSDPEALMKLTDEQLKSLLAPYIPETRKALLPEEKPSKIGLGARVMKDFMSDPNIMKQLEALKASRK